MHLWRETMLNKFRQSWNKLLKELINFLGWVLSILLSGEGIFQLIGQILLIALFKLIFESTKGKVWYTNKSFRYITYGAYVSLSVPFSLKINTKSFKKSVHNSELFHNEVEFYCLFFSFAVEFLSFYSVLQWSWVFTIFIFLYFLTVYYVTAH